MINLFCSKLKLQTRKEEKIFSWITKVQQHFWKPKKHFSCLFVLLEYWLLMRGKCVGWWGLEVGAHITSSELMMREPICHNQGRPFLPPFYFPAFIFLLHHFHQKQQQKVLFVIIGGALLPYFRRWQSISPPPPINITLFNIFTGKLGGQVSTHFNFWNQIFEN